MNMTEKIVLMCFVLALLILVLIALGLEFWWCLAAAVLYSVASNYILLKIERSKAKKGEGE